MLKNIRCNSLNTEMAKTVTLGSANPPTLTSLRGGTKMTIINVRWSPLNAKMAKTVTLGLGKPLTVTNLGEGAQKMTFIYRVDG